MLYKLAGFVPLLFLVFAVVIVIAAALTRPAPVHQMSGRREALEEPAPKAVPLTHYFRPCEGQAGPGTPGACN